MIVSWLREGWADQLQDDAGDFSFEYEVVTDEALGLEAGHPRSQAGGFYDHDEVVSGLDATAKLYFIDSGKTEELFAFGIEFQVENKGADLGGHFDHEHAGHEGTTGDVTASPEFFGTLVFESDGEPAFDIEVDQFVELLELVALTVEAEHLFLGKCFVGSVEGCEIDDGV